MGKKISICKNCNLEFSFYARQSKGIYCSNSCQGEFKVKSNLKEGTTMTKGMRKYINKLLGDNCSICTQGRIWNNLPLVLQIDHINGNIKDNRIENLRLLCPNCHTQTENWGINNISEEGRNRLITGGVKGSNKTNKIAL